MCANGPPKCRNEICRNGRIRNDYVSRNRGEPDRISTSAETLLSPLPANSRKPVKYFIRWIILCYTAKPRICQLRKQGFFFFFTVVRENNRACVCVWKCVGVRWSWAALHEGKKESSWLSKLYNVCFVLLAFLYLGLRFILCTRQPSASFCRESGTAVPALSKRLHPDAQIPV